MRVRDIAVTKARPCDPGTNLAQAAWIMWENDCGVVPVVDAHNKVVGMLTDRDVCMAVATRRLQASDITAGEVITGRVYSCRPDEDIRVALRTMAEHGVRRLPVVNEAGQLTGILSVSDLILAARDARATKPGDLTWGDVMTAMGAICRPRAAAKEPTKLVVVKK